MGLLDFFRPLPEWAKHWPMHLRPSAGQIRRLEAIRIEFGIPHAEFKLHIAGHSRTTKRALMHLYQEGKRQEPDASERDLLRRLVISRYLSSVMSGGDLFGLAAVDEDQGEDQDEYQDEDEDQGEFSERVGAIVSSHPTIESLVDAIIREEEATCPLIGPAPGFEEAAREAARRVEEVLNEE